MGTVLLLLIEAEEPSETTEKVGHMIEVFGNSRFVGS
jgi:hypothetical protein